MESMDACSRFPSFSDLTWDPLRDGSHVSQLLWCPNATLKREKPGRSGSLRFLGFPSISYAGQMLRSLPSCHCLAIWDLQDLHRSESVDLKLIFKRFTTQQSEYYILRRHTDVTWEGDAGRATGSYMRRTWTHRAVACRAAGFRAASVTTSCDLLKNRNALEDF